MNDPHPEDKQRTFPTLVACAVIICDWKILLERRAPSGVPGLDGMWDLPGGKVECGESPAEAVVREIREEIGLRISVRAMIPALKCSKWTYADGERHWVLAAFVCEVSPDSNVSYTSEDLKWFALDELPLDEMLEPDKEFIDMVRWLFPKKG